MWQITPINVFTVCTIISKIPFPALTQRKFAVVGGRFYRCQVRIWPPQNTTAWLQDQWVLYNVCAGSNLIFSSSNFFVLWEITSFQQNPGGNPAGFSCQQLCSPQTPLQAFFASSCYLHTIPCWGWSVLLVRRKLQLPLCPLSSLDISSDAENKDTPRGMSLTAASSGKVVFWGAGEQAM